MIQSIGRVPSTHLQAVCPPGRSKARPCRRRCPRQSQTKQMQQLLRPRWVAHSAGNPSSKPHYEDSAQNAAGSSRPRRTAPRRGARPTSGTPEWTGTPCTVHGDRHGLEAGGGGGRACRGVRPGDWEERGRKATHHRPIIFFSPPFVWKSSKSRNVSSACRADVSRKADGGATKDRGRSFPPPRQPRPRWSRRRRR